MLRNTLTWKSFEKRFKYQISINFIFIDSSLADNIAKVLQPPGIRRIRGVIKTSTEFFHNLLFFSRSCPELLRCTSVDSSTVGYPHN